MRMRILIAVLVLGACGWMIGCGSEAKQEKQTTQSQAVQPPTPANFIPNASFEDVRNNRPNGWRTEQWGGEGRFELASIGHTGNRSVSIISDKGADISWTRTVPVEPFAKYRLSGWIRTQDVKPSNGRGALLNLHGLDVATKAVSGTSDWTFVQTEFETGELDSVQVNCLFGGWGLATGTAWYDDVKLEQIGRTQLPAPSIVIDAGKTGEPISPYIYGQFIEHLGRCIYGGIWAEMLEDRKFYFAVGDRQSPWKVIGGKASMVRERPFVGEHTPSITGDGGRYGIVQGGLALTAGKRYEGRIWLGGGDASSTVQVSLVWGDGASDRQTISVGKGGEEFALSRFSFVAKGRTDDGRLEIASTGTGSFKIGTVSLMPADNVQGMRKDTMEVLRQLNSPVYRWPGGNFVSGYNWKDGIGERDRRPPRKNPAWQGVEHNDFGMDEFMIFCRMLKTEPYIAVNSGLGDATSAVEEMQYANGAADTPMGKWRAKNGHPEPYRVKFWGIGNEMYGNWQLGHMPLEDYVKKHNQFAEALRKVDPSAKLVAVGAVGTWSETMMQNCADHMDLISEHFYVQERPGLLGHVRQIPDNIKRIADAHRQYRQKFDSLKGKDIRIALDEWNYWYGPHVFGELGTRYFLKDALGIAEGLHEYARNSDIYYMANYAQTVNVIGAIKTSKRNAAFETTGLVLKLYRERFGTIPVKVESKGLIDAAAAWSADRKTLTVAVVNPTMSSAEIPMTLRGASLSGRGTKWQIAGNDPMAFNDPDQPAKVKIEESRVRGASEKLKVDPCSVTLFALDVR